MSSVPPDDESCDKCGKSLTIIHPWEGFNCHCPDESAPIHGTKETANMETLQKPYILLDPDFPGIVSLFMYDRDVAKNLTAMGETIMRRPRGLSTGERELIAAFVSKMNDCMFCQVSHQTCAEELLGTDLVDQVLNAENVEVLSMKMRHLLIVALHVQQLNRDCLPRAILEARNAGATDEEVHDTVLVTSFFSMCNRYVDGLGTTFTVGEPEEGGRSLATYGYTMGIRRFFREVFPKLWSRFWG